jgi:hypothetical protein
MPDRSHGAAATLGRLAFRLTIVLILSVLWSGDSPARAAGVLCLIFAAAVLWTAHAWGERPTGNGLNRWHEGAFLVILGLVLFFWFGRAPAGDHRSSVELFATSDWVEACIEAPTEVRLDGHPSRAQIIDGSETMPAHYLTGSTHRGSQGN